MPAPGARHLSFLLLLATALASCIVRAADPLAIVRPFGTGPYAVACNNLSQDFTRVQASESAADYWNGNPAGGRSRYVSDLLSDPAHTFVISVPIPADSDLYGRFAGASIDVVSLICYPTASNNPRPDYPLPMAPPMPHMQVSGDLPIWPDATTRFPVLLFSHGLSGSPISSEYINAIKVFASWGYVVISPFHGDLRIADITIENFSNALLASATAASIKAFIPSTPPAPSRAADV